MQDLPNDLGLRRVQLMAPMEGPISLGVALVALNRLYPDGLNPPPRTDVGQYAALAEPHVSVPY